MKMQLNIEISEKDIISITIDDCDRDKFVKFLYDLSPEKYFQYSLTTSNIEENLL